MKKQTLGRTKKRGPVPPPGGRVRITINLPHGLLKTVNALDGRSQSDKIVALIQSLASKGTNYD
jgi:hypothetical protein